MQGAIDAGKIGLAAIRFCCRVLNGKSCLGQDNACKDGVCVLLIALRLLLKKTAYGNMYVWNFDRPFENPLALFYRIWAKRIGKKVFGVFQCLLTLFGCRGATVRSG